MKSFPMFLKMSGRRVVIAGGGEQAAQKARLILKTEAKITLLATELDEELAALVASGRARHDPGPATVDSFAGAALVFIATGCAKRDESLHALAHAAGAVVNVVDRPDLCDATTPSIVDRDPVIVAIGTEGTAPVLARRIKTDIEARLDPSLGSFAALAGRLRAAVARRVATEDRRAFWEWAFADAPWLAHKRGATRAAAELLKSAMNNGRSSGAGRGHISLVGAGPGARDLLTLRAVERLQSADVIFYDRLVDPEVLELARRDAERVHVGKVVGASQWPQERINELIVSAARRGQSVVRLKSGDPSIFGRGSEELEAARAEGIPVEVVPGITAASAAAASLGRSLTERGATDRLILATGTCRPGDDNPDLGAIARPGTTMVLYMAVGKAREVQENLLRAMGGKPLMVEIVANASRSSETVLTCDLQDLARTLEREAVASPAVMILRNPKDASRAAVLWPRTKPHAVSLTPASAAMGGGSSASSTAGHIRRPLRRTGGRGGRDALVP